MKIASPDFQRPQRPGSGRWLACALAAALALGCSSRSLDPSHLAAASYQPSNFYPGPHSALDPSIRRVAVLPITTVSDTETFKAGAELMQQILGPELEKTKRFDLVIVSGEQLRHWTGQAAWRADEPLPTNFFSVLRDECACDAVFFAELIRYQPYQPVSVGWKLTLCRVESPTKVWAADENFDAGDAVVANAARRYSGEHAHNQGPLDDPDAILGSPSRFGQYTLNALLEHLPQR